MKTVFLLLLKGFESGPLQGIPSWSPFLAHLEACVAEQLTPQTADLEVRGSSLTRRVVSLDKLLVHFVSLLGQVYNPVVD